MKKVPKVNFNPNLKPDDTMRYTLACSPAVVLDNQSRTFIPLGKDAQAARLTAKSITLAEFI